MVILGSAVFERPDGTSIYVNAAQLSEKLRDVSSKEDKEWRVFNVLHRVGFFFSLKTNSIEIYYFSMLLKSPLLILALNQMLKYKNLLFLSFQKSWFLFLEHY